MISSTVIFLALLPLTLAQNCNKVETLEAQKSFKNCMESAQHTIISKAVQQKEANDLCDALDNMLSVCHRETKLLATCKGEGHALKVERLHLRATADIVKSLNQRADVAKCEVFQEKKEENLALSRQEDIAIDDGYGKTPRNAPQNGAGVVRGGVVMGVATLLLSLLM